jgi:hypothetical protein
MHTRTYRILQQTVQRHTTPHAAGSLADFGGVV